MFSIVRLVLIISFATAFARGADVPITEDELVRHTQELYNAIAPGNQAPWKRYFADDCIFSDEKGRTLDKTRLIADITPMPAGYSGAIKIDNRYYEDPVIGKIDPKKLGDFIGIYELAPGQTRSVTAEGENLFDERKGKKEQLFPETSNLFFRKGVEGRILFRYDDHGKIDALVDRRNNEDVVWRKMK